MEFLFWKAACVGLQFCISQRVRVTQSEEWVAIGIHNILLASRGAVLQINMRLCAFGQEESFGLVALILLLLFVQQHPC